MTNTTENNKRIVKNTLLLYIRMLFTIIVGLYTSRIVLDILGVSDYGIYNVVGGIITMLAFLNVAMTGASQRFISFELGRQNKERLKLVFSTSILIHFSLAGIVFIIAETIGLWFINTHLNIEPDRMVAANYTYQCSILSFILTIISVPYNSCIVAHEHMKAYAYVSILEVSLKLLIAYLLPILPADKLICYAIMSLSVAVIIRIVYGIYCKRHFEECAFHFTYDRQLFKNMFSFAGWNTLGNLGFSIKDQGANIILNIFFGTTINAARGIAIQVNSIINNFAQNFLMALNPQITKQYACNNIQQSVNFVYTGCKFSFYLLMIISIPFILNKEYLLGLWLKDVPQYTSLFLELTLIIASVEVLSYPLTTALQATGKIKSVQIFVCLIMLCELPAAYLILECGGKPHMTMYPTLLASIIKLFVRFYLLKTYIPLYNMRFFCNAIILKCFLVGISCFFISSFIKAQFDTNFISLIINVTLSTATNLLIIILLGLSSSEKEFFGEKIRLLIYHHKQPK